jgi:hypothetical protein
MWTQKTSWGKSLKTGDFLEKGTNNSNYGNFD